MADADRVFGGVRAVELMATECDTGAECSTIQHSIIARCVSNCNACDRVATGTVVGSCVADGHGSALSVIEDACDESDGQLHPLCSQLQLAVRDTCNDDCDACNVLTVHEVLGDCILEDESLAVDMTCTAAAAAAAAAVNHVQNACTPLQQEVIRGCAEDCGRVRFSCSSLMSVALVALCTGY